MTRERERNIVARHADAVVADANELPAAVLERDLDRGRPASIAFSTSSFTTEDGRSTTSPAAIWSATALGRIEINGILIPKLPILAPRGSRNVLFCRFP